MNSLHGIKISNDARVVRGQTLKFHKKLGMLSLRGEMLTSTFLTRKAATEWATRNGATVAAV